MIENRRGLTIFSHTMLILGIVVILFPLYVAFVAATLVITYFSARQSKGASAYFAAGRRITGWQNGLAVAGDYMSAASFLGIAGMIAMNGYDGFLYSVGFLVAYLTVLFLVAEPLRPSRRSVAAASPGDGAVRRTDSRGRHRRDGDRSARR